MLFRTFGDADDRTAGARRGHRAGDAHAAARGAGADARPRPRHRRRRRLPGRPPQRRTRGAARARRRDRHHVGDLRRHARRRRRQRCPTPPVPPVATRAGVAAAGAGRTDDRRPGAERTQRAAGRPGDDAAPPARRRRRRRPVSSRSGRPRPRRRHDRRHLARPHAADRPRPAASAPTPCAWSRTATSPRRAASPSTRASAGTTVSFQLARVRGPGASGAAPVDPAGRQDRRRCASNRVRPAPPSSIDGRVVGTTPLPDLRSRAGRARRCGSSCPGTARGRRRPPSSPGRASRVAASLEERTEAHTMKTATLALENGQTFEGVSIGADGETVRRGGVQHQPHRLPGGADRSLLLRPDRHDDRAADRQLRRHRRGLRVARHVGRRLRRARSVADVVELARRGQLHQLPRRPTASSPSPRSTRGR